MSTELNEVSSDVSTAVESNLAHVSKSKTIYRTYGAYDEKGQAVGVKAKVVKNPDNSETTIVEYSGKPSLQAETNTHDNWERAEKIGATLLTENQFEFYTLSSVNGIASLVPSEEQQLYIFQKGLNAIQTAAVAKLQTQTEEKKDKDDPDVFTYNGDTIDLREYINTPPEKKNLTEQEKFLRAVNALGTLNPDKVNDMVAQLQAILTRQQAATVME